MINKNEQRRDWMAVLAKADPATLQRLWSDLGDEAGFTTLRPAETGMVMVRGRAGGDGMAFALGEMTVTRCTVRLDGSEVLGSAYVAGRGRRHAEIAARADALLQTDRREAVETALIAPLRAAQAEARAAARRKAAATRVDFFTMVRGENPR
ncbi:phosphonate C-P lyase system protein PhnG [Inquilinus sp. Marseille-Q2685]|uniref:phosphonate C-P lyase system protein PhnG n=1 Tax=Inquilinus sp. Marseille-Q2685 TaxID=2866581 RepID=UPI001CE3D99F|nr:phosphonate C-P lyase system protein PhnG [Inquilinus sp. Marseille-Q2685]